MKYAVIKVTDGNYGVHSEGFTDVAKAKVSYHGLCTSLWNADDVITAEVMLVDENLDCVDKCREFIHHEVKEPEESTEPTESLEIEG